MREILFKAKRIDNGEWVEGSYIKSQPINEYAKTNASMIICENGKGKLVQIDETTLCQYTGLTDKNGNKIWENDLIECKGHNHHFISQIEWDDYCCGFIFQDSKTSAVGLDALSSGGCCRWFEIKGNVFDNPELVKGGGTDAE